MPIWKMKHTWGGFQKSVMPLPTLLRCVMVAFPLAATGMLDGRVATTFPGDRDRFANQFPEIDVRYDQHVVIDGKFITSVGGALSYEPAFYLVEKLYGKENADLIAQGLVWNWDLKTVPHLVVSSDI